MNMIDRRVRPAAHPEGIAERPDWAPRQANLYRVTFHDGRSINLVESCAPRAEASAKRKNPGGFVRRVKFLRKVTK